MMIWANTSRGEIDIFLRYIFLKTDFPELKCVSLLHVSQTREVIAF